MLVPRRLQQAGKCGVRLQEVGQLVQRQESRGLEAREQRQERLGRLEWLHREEGEVPGDGKRRGEAPELLGDRRARAHVVGRARHPGDGAMQQGGLADSAAAVQHEHRRPFACKVVSEELQLVLPIHEAHVDLLVLSCRENSRLYVPLTLLAVTK